MLTQASPQKRMSFITPNTAPCRYGPLSPGSYTRSSIPILITSYRNEKHLAPSGPFIYLPPILLPSAYRPRVGTRLCTLLRLHCPALVNLHLCPLHRLVLAGLDSRVLRDPAVVRARWRSRIADGIPRRAWTETRRSARPIHAAGREGPA